jgi:HK97 family phage major capsid protein
MSDHEDAARVRDIANGFANTTKRLDQTITAHNSAVRNFSDRIEALEARADLPRGGGTVSSADREHTKTFCAWIRKPADARRIAQLTDCEYETAKLDGRKDVVIGTGSAGGFGLPKEINAAIEYRVRQLNPFRQLVDVQQCMTNDYHSLVSMSDATSGWVAETATRSATLSPTLRDRAPTFGELYSYPTCSEWALEDIFFDVASWITNDVSADFAAAEATAIISGNGTARPTGILNTTPTTSSDSASPMRAAHIIQYVPLTTPTSPVKVNMDSLITLIHTVAERYTMESDRCAFVCHRLTVAALRQQKASTAGVYMWNDTVGGVPPTLLGYPVYTCDAMPLASTASNFAVLFGNWFRGYLLVDRVGTRITMNPYSVPGMVSFYVRRRVGGCVKNNDALKALRIKET